MIRFNEERSARKVTPDNIKAVFDDNVTEISLAQMQHNFALSQSEKFLFDYDHWEYEGTDNCWKGQFLNCFAPHGQQTTFCVAECADNRITEPALNMIRAIGGWTNEVLHIKNPYAGNGLFPLAYFDGRLYFINNPNHITMNDKWGNGTIYYIRTNNFAVNAEFINTDVVSDRTKIFTLSDNDPKIIKTSQLGNFIYERSANIIDTFIAQCKSNADEKIAISYQDEHMKSILAIMTSLQTIGFFIKKMGNPFSLEFRIERYDSDNGKRDNLGANQPSSRDRDQWLESMANMFVDDLDMDGISGTLVSIQSVPKHVLTHWRVLSFECAGKKLSIYPDGGFMNGWFIYNAPGKHAHHDLETITYGEEVDLFRNVDIKFDVTIEDK